MRGRGIGVVVAALMLGFAAPAFAAPPDWRAPNADNTLVIDTSKGRIVVEMQPEFAPMAVERVKKLTREHVYDGLLFHRVIDHFVAQTGNPNNRDGGGTSYPDLKTEFTFRLAETSAWVTVARGSDALYGLLGAVPFEAERTPRPGAALRGWGAYCPGAVGMGRQAPPDSANS